MKRSFLAIVLCLACMTTWAATVKVGVLLPLKEKTERGNTLVEFYQGLLMAVEQVKAEGTSVDVYAIDCGSSETQLRQALQQGDLAYMDVIFGPVDAVQVPTLADYCQQHGIRMVLPFNTPCPQVYGNPWIYQVGVPQELLYPGIATLVLDHLANSNFVMFHTGETDARAQGFMEHMGQVLRLRGMQTTALNANGDEFAYDRALNQFRNNVIILDSRSLTAVNKLLAGIKAYQMKYPQYKVTLFGYPEWLTYTNTLLKDFYAYDTYVFSSYYRNPLSGRVAKFEQHYQANYGRPSRVSYPRAEMLGYDLGYYFMHGIATLGGDFDEQQGTLQQQPVQHAFNFQRIGEKAGYANLNVQLVHYSTNNTIQVVK